MMSPRSGYGVDIVQLPYSNTMVSNGNQGMTGMPNPVDQFVMPPNGGTN